MSRGASGPATKHEQGYGVSRGWAFLRTAYRMLSRCHFCDAALPGNDEVEHFATGSRIAWDPWRGRLWAVCRGCGRWTLAPFESRWEALEELERIARDHGRVLASTENVSLIRVREIDLVRVGKAPLREEAWWRYGDEVVRRSKRKDKLAVAGKVFDGALAFLLVGVPYWGWSRAEKWLDRARHVQFGRYAWRGESRCRNCAARERHITFDDRRRVRLAVTGIEDIALWLPCRRCGLRGDALGAEASGGLIAGAEAERALRRLLAYHNYAGANRADVIDAAQRIEAAESAAGFLHTVGRDRAAVCLLSATDVLALEIAANERIERRLLEAEAHELEKRWRDEERIAAIADGELTPGPEPAAD